MSLLTILIVLLILSIVLGGYGSSRPGWGYYGWSPAGLIVLLIIVLFLLGYVRV